MYKKQFFKSITIEIFRNPFFWISSLFCLLILPLFIFVCPPDWFISSGNKYPSMAFFMIFGGFIAFSFFYVFPIYLICKSKNAMFLYSRPISRNFIFFSRILWILIYTLVIWAIVLISFGIKEIMLSFWISSQNTSNEIQFSVITNCMFYSFFFFLALAIINFSFYKLNINVIFSIFVSVVFSVIYLIIFIIGGYDDLVNSMTIKIWLIAVIETIISSIFLFFSWLYEIRRDIKKIK